MERTVLQLDDDLQLGTWEYEDGSYHFILVENNREHLGKFLGWVDTFTHVLHSYSFMERMVADYEAGRAIRFGIRYKRELVGAVNLVVTGHQQAELGIWLGQNVTGKGIANRSATAAINHAKTRLGLTRVVFRLRTANDDSRAFITRLGFTFEAIEPQAEEDKGQLYDLERYALAL